MELTTDQKGAIAETAIIHAAVRLGDGLRKRVYRADEVDFVAAYCPELERCFLLPADQFDRRTQVDLRLNSCGNNQRRGINGADDFAFDARLTTLLGP